MKLELSLRMILVFLVPGTFVLSGVALVHSGTLKFFEVLIHDPSVDRLVLTLVGCFILGSVADSARAVVVDRLVDRQLGHQVKNYITNTTKDELEVLRYVIEESQVYYRLNANCLMPVSLTLVATCSKGEGVWIFASLLGGGVFLAGTLASRRDVFALINQFAEGKNNMCQGLPCVGHRVALREDVLEGGVVIPANTEGTITQEFADERRVQVEITFDGRTYSLKLHENDLHEL